MRASEAMTREVRVCTPGQSIRDCARTMAEIDAGPHSQCVEATLPLEELGKEKQVY